MQAAHCQDQERLTLQKQVTEIRLEAKEAQELVQSCRIRDRPYAAPDVQLTAAENEIRLVQEQVSRKAGRNRRPDDKPGRPKTTVGRTERRPNFETANDGGE